MSRRILAIDDNEIVGLALRARLGAADYEVEIASSAIEAFAILKRERFELVLLDLEMPGVGGLDALAIINLLDLCQSAPVILLTASDEERNVRRARELGARGYLTKDAAAETLIRHIDRLFEEPQTNWLDDYICVYTAKEAPPTPASHHKAAEADASIPNRSILRFAE